MIILLKVLIGLVLLSFIMVFHEWGHYIVGRLLNFKVLSFNIFMGPNLLSKLAKNGVRYNLKALPIGASVEFSGELSEDSFGNEFVSSEDNAEGSPGEDFFKRPRWARALVAVAGPAMNFITAFLAFLIIYTMSGVLVPRQAAIDKENYGLAQANGLEAGDLILKYNGQKIKTSYDLSLIEMMAKPGPVEIEIQKSDGQRKLIKFNRDGEKRPLLGISYGLDQSGQYLIAAVDPRSNNGQPVFKVNDQIIEIENQPVKDEDAWRSALAKVAREDGKAKILVIRDGKKVELLSSLTSIDVLEKTGIFFSESKNVSDILSQAVHTPWSLLKMTYKSLAMVLRGELPARSSLAGPIRMVQIVGDTVHASRGLTEKLSSFFLLFGLISVGIGTVQLVPIPPFDGHHILILAIEGIRRKDLSVKTKHAIATAGFFLLVGLLFLTLYLDLSNLLS